MSYSAESVGSNNSQKITRKCKRGTDSSASSSKVMSKSDCPALRDDNSHRVTVAAAILRLAHNSDIKIGNISKNDVESWQALLDRVNYVDDDINLEQLKKLVLEIKDIHSKFYCDCLGKSVCENVTDLGFPLKLKKQLISVNTSTCTGDGGSSGSNLFTRLKSTSAPSSSFEMAHFNGPRLAHFMKQKAITGVLKSKTLHMVGNSPATVDSLLSMTDDETYYFLKQLDSHHADQWLNKCLSRQS